MRRPTDRDTLLAVYDELREEAPLDGGPLDWALGRIFDQVSDFILESKSRPCDLEAYYDYTGGPLPMPAEAAALARWKEAEKVRRLDLEDRRLKREAARC